MAVTKGHGNPAWSRDETILALDLYFQVDGQIPSPRDQQVIDLSDLLRSLPYHAHAARQQTFRNPDGVGFKLMNLRAVATGKGLTNVSKTDKAIWEEFGNRPEEVSRISAAIREGLTREVDVPAAVQEPVEFREGRYLTLLHLRRERNPRVRQMLLDDRKSSGLRCEICDHERADLPFDLHAASFEAHHLVPIAETGERRTRISDLALLCANCHRLIHKLIANEGRWIGVTEARSILRPQTVI